MKSSIRQLQCYLAIILAASACVQLPQNQPPSGGGGQLEMETLDVIAQEMEKSNGIRLFLSNTHKMTATDVWSQCEINIIHTVGNGGSAVHIVGERQDGTPIVLADTFFAGLTPDQPSQENWTQILNHKEFYGPSAPAVGKGTNAFTTYQIVFDANGFDEAVGMTYVTISPQQNMSVITYDQDDFGNYERVLAHEIGHVLGLSGTLDPNDQNILLMFEEAYYSGDSIPLADCVVAQQVGNNYGFFN